MLEIEEWRDVVGYEKSHAVSSLGRIKLKNNIVTRKDGKNCNIKEKILTPRLEKNGYYRINLRKRESRKAFSIHRLVCEAFHGPATESKTQVDHINGVRSDNRAENLRWVSPRENIHHSITAGRINVVGVNNPAAKLTEEQVFEICHLLDTTDLFQEAIAQMYNTSQSVISAINVGSQWNSLTGRKKV